MTTTLNQQEFIAAQVNAISQFQSVAQTALNAVESFAALNLNAFREGFEKAAAHGKDLIGAKNPQEVATLTVASVKPNSEKAAEYSKSVYAISSEAAQEIGDLFKAQFEEVQKSVKQATQTAIKSFPFGSDIALAAVKQAEDAATKAYDNINTAVSKAKAIAEDNFASVTKTVKTARKAK